MIKWSIARRYARALFESVGSDFERAGRELTALDEALRSSPEVSAVFSDPRMRRSQRVELMERVLGSVSVLPMVANFFRLLAERNRLDQLPGIVQVFQSLVNEKLNRVEAEVLSAVPLEDEMIERLSGLLSDATGKQVVVRSEAKPEILGGLVARIGNVVYDGSLRTQLQTLRRELANRA